MDDEQVFPEMFDEADPTARGIVQCLRMLAEEAASLRLGRTLDALEAAIRVCAAESDTADECDGPPCAPPGTMLH